MITLSGVILCMYAMSARKSLPKYAVFSVFNLTILAGFLLLLRVLQLRLMAFAMLHFGII